MSVKIAGGMPDEENSGVYLLQEQLVKRPQDRHVVVMVIDCGSQTVKYGEKGREITPTARALFVEPIRDEEDVNDVVAALGRARATRLGRDELDFEEFGVGDPFESLARNVIDSARDFAAENENTKPQEQDDDNDN
ncbi:hypothetical protein [Pseudoclavibacter sp. AY1H1]|uniref:hypothetical protein n=1 Tax=Pseudoclavibacter sp. AY1H1 TaxID=2080584 RepID=UPI000CE726D0|nr:hypothetical protein [Pseudoclavibacter sp. AY1H1]PPF39943.1 hypothetical protein C5E05_01655 [Pseudoclavibacter sp. AY1H1]